LLLKVPSHHCLLQLTDNASWRGTPGEYVVLCNHYLHTLGSLLNCEYHVNATTNTAVLQRLDSAKSYLVYIKMCNEEKMCGPDSEPYIIKERQGGLTMYVCVGGWRSLSSCFLKGVTIKYMSVKKSTQLKLTRETKLPQHPQELSQQPSWYIVPFVVTLTTQESYDTHGLLIAHLISSSPRPLFQSEASVVHNHSYENEFNLHVNEISFSYELGY